MELVKKKEEFENRKTRAMGTIEYKTQMKEKIIKSEKKPKFCTLVEISMHVQH